MNHTTNPQALRAVLTVTAETRPDGGHYFDQADFVAYVTEWVRAALKDKHAISEVTIVDQAAELARAQAEAHQYRTALQGVARRAAEPSVVVSADRATLRDRIRRAVCEAEGFGWDTDMLEPDEYGEVADAVLAVLPEQTDRATLLREAAEDERPLSPDYEHPECGFHWHGRDGMDIPMRDGQPVCPRCELAKVEKKLAYVQRMRDEVGEECKRRGRIKLEQAERIVRLERELDGVRDQLGKEMLRADDAEAELRRVAAEEQPTETQDGDRAALIAELLPVWEAVYEPGNVSDYLIGYANDQDAATGMAEAWMRSQAEVTGRLEWTPWGDATPMPDGYDAWFELVERHDDGIATGPGIIVRRRIEPAVAEQPDTQTREARAGRCSAVMLRVHHAPHGWEPQPGMDPVHCPGYPQPAP